MALINTRMATNTSITTAGVLPVGDVVHKSGCGLSAGSNTVSISGAGYYKVIANVSYSPTADGIVTTSITANGAVIATAQNEATATDPVNSTMVAVVYNKCGCSNVALNVTVNAVGIVNEVDIVVERI